MEQKHVFDGFRYGEKDQRNLLASEIVTVNSKLLQQALQNIEVQPTRPDLLQILSAVPRSNKLKVSDDPHHKLQTEGCALTSSGKVATVLVLDEIEEIEKTIDSSLINSEGNENVDLLLKALLDDQSRFIKTEDRPNVPLLLMCSSGSVNSLQELFSDHDYFSFDPQKVLFLEEEKLPLVRSSTEEQSKHKILMKSPWEILQRPIGSGGIITLLSSHDSLLDDLGELGVEYIQVRKINQEQENDHSLVGLVDSCKANVGVRLFKDVGSDENLDVILSMSFLRKRVKQMSKMHFEAVQGCESYVEKVEKEWIDVIPTAPNCYEFRSSVYCCLDSTPTNKICVLCPKD